MSADCFTEILNYLSAMSRDVGGFRQEFRQFRDETNTRFERIEQRLDKVESRFGKTEEQLETLRGEQRQAVRLISRVMGALQIFRSDVDELGDRVTALERKGT